MNRRVISLSPEEKYLVVDMGYKTPCWIWQFDADRNGYGSIRLPDSRQRIAAHKYFFQKVKGPVPNGLDLDHLCRIKSCVNPDHLEAVTRSVNMKRAWKHISKQPFKK